MSKSVAEKLNETIDKSRLFTMIYSGVESRKYFDVLYDMGIRDFLISYHYIKNKSFDADYFRSLGIRFFVDSGAYTFINNEKFQNQSKEFWEEYICEYLAWAEENKDIIFAIANLDLENIFNFETTQEWNMKYFEPFMIRTGVPVCFIWHSCDGIKGWEYYTKRYPYTGFSWVSDDDGSSLDLDFGKKMLDIARKNDSVCHGMGMTRTSMLTKMPFYTSDSTTWMVGLQYGEVNYWTGTKMSRLKKEKWKGEYLEKIVKIANLDRQKFLDEDPVEMIKANVTAFMLAEDFIHQRLKPRMYWLKPKKTENSSETFEFPDEAWLRGETNFNGYEEIARSMNINPDQPKDTVLDCIFNMTVILNVGNPEYDEICENTLSDSVITNLHQHYINTICPDVEEQLNDLEKFFRDNLEGKDETLLLMGTNFDVVAKERDKYIEEEEFEQVDVSEQEYNKLVSDLGLLPAPDSEAPEIDELDKEIFDQTGYVAVRDEKGRFLKGQKTVKKQKHIYSEKYPKLACSTCYAAQTCPEYKEGYVCAFNKMFKRFDCRKMEDILEAMQGMVNLNMERMQREAIFETLNGGMAGGTLTNLIDQNMRLLMNMKQVYSANEAVVKQVRTIQADGTVQETTQVNSNGGSGVMEMLMKNMMNKEKKEGELDINDVIDVNPEDIKEIK